MTAAQSRSEDHLRALLLAEETAHRNLRAVVVRVQEHLERAYDEGRNWCPTANDEQAHDIEMMAAVCLGYLEQGA